MGSVADAARPASLADSLRSMDDEALAALLRARPDLVRPLPDDFTDLAARASTPFSLRCAWNRLDLLQQQLLAVLVAQQRPVGPTELHTALGTDHPAIVEALTGLRQAALVWGPPQALRTTAAVAQLIGPAPCGLDPVDRSTRPQIQRYLLDRAQLLDEVAAAPSGAREVLDQLLWAPYGSVANAERTVTRSTARTPVEWLLARDLLVPQGPGGVVLPREVALLLRGGRYVRELALPPPPPQHGRRPLVPDADATGGLQSLLATRAARRLLDLLGEGWVRLLRNGGVYQRDAAELARRLMLPPTDTAVLADTLWTAGLIAADEESGRWGLTAASDAWRVLPEGRAWAALVHGWLDSPRHVGSDMGNRMLSDELLVPSVARTRHSVLAAAVHTTPNSVVDPDGIAAHLRWQQPRQGGHPEHLVAEVLQQADLLGLFGRGALTAAGRAAAGSAPDRDPDQLAGAVRWPALVSQLLFQADLTATSLGPLTRAAEQRIELLADLESTGAGAGYRISAGSLERAFDGGLSPTEVLSEINALAATAVPATVTALVSDVGRRHGLVVVHACASVVASEDEAALAAAVADRTLAGLHLRLIAPGIAVSIAPQAEVVAALRRAGVPAVGPLGSRRSRPARLPAPTPTTVWEPDPEWIDAAIRAVRTGERIRREVAEAGRPRPVGPHELVDLLTATIRDQQQLWLDSADSTGQRRVRLVEPLSLRAGVLSGFDHLEQRVRGFPLSRIIGVAAVEQPRDPEAT